MVSKLGSESMFQWAFLMKVLWAWDDLADSPQHYNLTIQFKWFIRT